MRLGSAVFVVLLVVMASCGSSPDVPDDTSPVGDEPRAETEAAPVEPVQPLPRPTVGVPAGPHVGGETKLAFAAGTRFVVFAREAEPSFFVFDRDRGEGFRVLGSPMGQVEPSYARYLEMGLASGAPQWRLQEDGEGRMLVRSAGGVQLVDLVERGRMIAAWRGTPRAASLAPDGRTFAVATTDAVHVVRASDGAFATFAVSADETELTPSWSETSAFWVDGDELVRVDRETLKATVIRGGGKSRFATSSDANVVAVASEGTVAVYADRKATPLLRIATPDVSELLVAKDGAYVVWVERVIDETTFSDKGHLHAIDVAARTHVRFAMVNSGCGNAPESVQEVRDGKIVSDPSCAIGCPSVRWTHRTVVYDAHDGRILEDTSSTEEKSWNEEQGELQERVEALAKKLRVETSTMLHHPKDEAVLVARNDVLSLVKLPNVRESVALEASAGASLAHVTFSSDGAIIAGVVNERARAWDAVTGRALLR